MVILSLIPDTSNKGRLSETSMTCCPFILLTGYHWIVLKVTSLVVGIMNFIATQWVQKLLREKD